MFGISRTVTDWGARGAFLTDLDLPGRQPRALYLLGLLLATLPAIAGNMLYSGQTDNAAFLPATYSALAILVVWVLNKLLSPKPRNWLGGDTFFLALFWLFHFTYLVYYSFDWVLYDVEVFLVPATVWRATLFCVLSLVVFLAAYEMTGWRYPPLREAPRLMPAPPGTLLVGKVLVTLCLVFMLGVLLSVGVGTLMTDYRSLIRIGMTTGGRFFFLGLSLGAVALAIYCGASGLNHFKAMSGPVWFVIGSALTVLPLLLGDRGGFIFLAAVPVLAFHYFQRRVGLPILIVLMIALLFISTVVAISRNTITMDVTKMYAEYKYRAGEASGNALDRALVEFGTSIKTVVVAMDLVPRQYPYWRGRSYWGSLMIAIPNVIPGQIRAGEGLGEWLNDVAYGTNRTSGRGGSIAMEAYVNFGYVGGILSFALLGVCFRALYERFLRRPDLLRIVLFFAANSSIMLWVRNTSFVMPRTMLWALGAAWLIQTFFKRPAGAVPRVLPPADVVSGDAGAAGT